MSEATINLVKGQKLDLTKDAGAEPGLDSVIVGLGWDPANTGKTFDLDASVVVIGASGKMATQGDLVFFGNLKHSSGHITHTGDNLTGEGDGDDEQIIVDLQGLINDNPDVEKLLVVVNIYDAVNKGQNFGQVNNSYMRIVDKRNDQELARFDLNFDASADDGIIFGSLIKRNGSWYFSADNTQVGS